MILLLLLGCQPITRPTPVALLQSEAQPPTIVPTGLSTASSPNRDSTEGHAAIAQSTDVTTPLTVTLSGKFSGTLSITLTTPFTAAAAAFPPLGEVSAEMISAGQEIYLKQYCGICHQLDALGTRGTFGPPHNGIGQRAAERIQEPIYHGHAQTAAEYLMESLIDPTIYIVPEYALTSHPMPDYSYLSEADRQALVAMLLAQQ